MKTIFLITFLSCLCCFGSHSHASGISVKPGGSYYNFDNSSDVLEDAHAKTIGVEFLFTDYFGVEFGYSKADSNFVNSPLTGEFEHTKFNFLFNMVENTNAVVPYLNMGVSEADVVSSNNRVDETFVNVGAGVKLNLTNYVAVYTDVQAFNSTDDHNTSSAVNVGLSLTLPFTKATPPQAKAVEVAERKVVIEHNLTIETVGEIKQADPEENVIPPVDQTLSTVYFDFNSTVVNSKEVDELKQIVHILNKNSSINLALYGHADSTGDFEYNKVLSQKRVDSVVKVLVEVLGLDPNRIVTTKHYGETDPIASNNDQVGRQQNRRVNITFVY